MKIGTVNAKIRHHILGQVQCLHLEVNKQMHQTYPNEDSDDIEKRYDVAQRILREPTADTSDSLVPAPGVERFFSHKQLQQEILRKKPNATADILKSGLACESA